MKWLIRPSVLIVLLLALVVGAGATWFLFRPDQSGPTPLPISPGDREIVWLAQATSAGTWERFVSALKLTAETLKDDLPGLSVDVDPARTFPQQSTAVPEASMTWNGAGGKLVFRWYKLTSERKPRDWVRALLKDRPAPLAIIGGSNSDNARDLALQLRAATEDLPANQRPLLFLTTATANRVPLPPDVPRMDELDLDPDPVRPAHLPQSASLNRLYPDRTFRFCFSNQQMSEAVTNFIWSRAEFKPEGPPAHLVRWADDTYSADLVNGFVKALRPHDGGHVPFSSKEVESSVGTFDTANRFEVMQVRDLLRELDNTVRRKPALLVLAGQTLPSRRFLRELARLAPEEARRLVVASGDVISFNTVYRDRLVTWPIQDLPYPLVFFCHANPTNTRAGFTPPRDGLAGARELGDTGATGTEDVLLFTDIVSALVQAAAGERELADAPRLSTRLHQARYLEGRIVFGEEGRVFFEANGDRANGTGEHVVWLQPKFDAAGRIVQPVYDAAGRITLYDATGRLTAPAVIEVFTWRDGPNGPGWEARCKPLGLQYEEAPATTGEPR